MNNVKIEDARKAYILKILIGMAIILLSVFSVISFIKGDKYGALENLIVLIFVLAGFLYMRLKGSFVFASYVLTLVLALQFISDFSSDTNSAMWSFTIPILSFFLIGMRPGAVLSGVYLLSALALMFFLLPDNYALEFKLRFPAIYLSITFFTYIYEKNRIATQKMMEEVQSRLQKEKDKLVESDRALKYFKSMVEGKTITLS